MVRPFVERALAAAAVAALVASAGCALILDLEEGIPRGNSGSGGSGASASSTGGGSCDPKVECPAPSTACLEATCDGDGTCGTENAPAGTACTDNGGTVCDGQGTCGSCGDPAVDCPETGNECIAAVCAAGQCSTMILPDGAETASGQAAGDCKKQVCDGAGATKIVDDDDPADDANDCTADLCNQGSNLHTNVSSGVPCAQNDGKVCGSGTKAGTCVECLANVDCNDPDKGICDTQNDNFVCVPSSCSNSMKDGTETGIDCGGPSCGKCGNGQMCNSASDCASSFCNAGTCAGCAGDADCANNEFCNGGSCTPDKPLGSACAAASQCVSASCVDGVCCDSACNAVCQACSGAKKGAGADGACGNVAANFDPDMECSGATSCNGGGACQLAPGAPCATGAQCQGGLCVDGVCCSTACNAPCEACSVAKKGQGSDGTCGSVAINTDPDNDCPGFCDGASSCQLLLGDSCGTPDQCPGGLNCVDGYCCNNECTGTCMSCDGNKTFGGNGTCAEITSGTDPDNECFSWETCFSGLCQ